MSTLIATRLTRQDYDDLYDAWTQGDLRDAIRALYRAVEGIVERHQEAGR